MNELHDIVQLLTYNLIVPGGIGVMIRILNNNMGEWGGYAYFQKSINGSSLISNKYMDIVLLLVEKLLYHNIYNDQHCKSILILQRTKGIKCLAPPIV